MTLEYTYLGDRLTDPRFKGKQCAAVRRQDGKCIRGKNGSMLVRFASGETVVVIGRLLRKIPEKSPLLTGFYPDAMQSFCSKKQTMNYQQNVRQKAEELAKVRLPQTWNLLPGYLRQQEIEWAIPQVEKALEWAAEIAHQVNGPQLGKEIINSMLQVLGVIPEDINKSDSHAV